MKRLSIRALFFAFLRLFRSPDETCSKFSFRNKRGKLRLDLIILVVTDLSSIPYVTFIWDHPVLLATADFCSQGWGWGPGGRRGVV